MALDQPVLDRFEVILKQLRIALNPEKGIKQLGDAGILTRIRPQRTRKQTR